MLRFVLLARAVTAVTTQHPSVATTRSDSAGKLPSPGKPDPVANTFVPAPFHVHGPRKEFIFTEAEPLFEKPDKDFDLGSTEWNATIPMAKEPNISQPNWGTTDLDPQDVDIVFENQSFPAIKKFDPKEHNAFNVLPGNHAQELTSVVTFDNRSAFKDMETQTKFPSNRPPSHSSHLPKKVNFVEYPSIVSKPETNDTRAFELTSATETSSRWISDFPNTYLNTNEKRTFVKGRLIIF